MIEKVFRLLYLPLHLCRVGLPTKLAVQYVRVVRRLLLLVTRRRMVQLPFGFSLALGGKDFIQRHLLFFNVWEPTLSFWISHSLKEGDVFYDVGANIGYFTLLASQRVGDSGQVVAIEASPSIHAELTATTSLKSNVTCLNIAVGDRLGTTPIYKNVQDNSGLSSIFNDGDTAPLSLEAEVSMQPLDSIRNAIAGREPRLIKIDVEGAEWLVIGGMQQILAADNPDLEIIVEFEAPRLAKFGISSADFFQLFRRHGFFPYDLNNRYLTEEYLPKAPIPLPTPVTSAPQEQTDILFSRATPEQISCRFPQMTVAAFLRSCRETTVIPSEQSETTVIPSEQSETTVIPSEQGERRGSPTR